jgi:hypothetical protein
MKPQLKATIVISTWLVGPIADIKGCGREVWSIAGMQTVRQREKYLETYCPCHCALGLKPPQKESNI